MADARPLVLVLEDLHWADESLLDFVDELVDWVTDVPLLVVGTARPELLERRPGWGGGKLNATTLALRPLSDEETAGLVGQLLERPLIAAESQQGLLERAGGNPLYAEQYADLFRERGSVDELPLPETVQGLIAARLDGLPPEEKELLRDAAVMGKIFWVGALGREGHETATTLHSLQRKGFIRRQRQTSVEGETELAFAHALMRDVAYGQIARADRAEKHRAVATWIESLGRPEDHAEMRAHHWGAALELAHASGHETADLADRARLALRDAGDRAFALNAFAAAEAYYADAIALWPEDDPAGADLLFRRARALYDSGDERREQALAEARDALLHTDDRETAGEAESMLGHVQWYRGRRELADRHLQHASELVADAAPSRAKARVLALSARLRMLADDSHGAIRLGEEALAVADVLFLQELRAQALSVIGAAKFIRDRTGSGNSEMQEALAIARAVSSPYAIVILNNLGVQAGARGELLESRPLYAEAEALALRTGDATQAAFMRANGASTDLELGDWDNAARALDELIEHFEHSRHYSESLARRSRAVIRLARGNVDGALEDCELSLSQARNELKDPQTVMQALAESTWVLAHTGHVDRARRHAEEMLELYRQRPIALSRVTDLASVAERLDLVDELRDVLEYVADTPWRTAAELQLAGDHSAAATVFDEMGSRWRAAGARLAAAESRAAQGRRAEGEAELEKALEFYRSVGATFFVGRGEALLARAAYGDSA
jgi:tetratricopeptide (TPR) repeat protein